MLWSTNLVVVKSPTEWNSAEKIGKKDYLEGMEAFITRKNLTTGRLWGPSQRISREEALRMATIWAARFYDDEKIMGSIEPGKLADLVVLGGDYMTVPEEGISDIPVLKVIVGGKATYERKAN